MRKILFIIASILITTSAFAQSKNVSVIDTPTAFTLGRGVYQIQAMVYGGGGVELKASVGLIKNLYLGVSFDVQHLIGFETPQVNIPGVVLKFKITDGWKNFPLAISFGYDSFYYGSEGLLEDRAVNEYNKMIYGPYFVLTHTFFLFHSEQYLSFGVRLPVQPYFIPNDTSYFLSLDIPLGNSFRIKGEIERVFWNFSRSTKWMFNFGIRYTYNDQLGIELGFMWQFDQPIDRVLRVVYIDSF